MKISLLCAIGMIVVLFSSFARGDVVVAGNARFYEGSQIHQPKVNLVGAYLSEGGAGFTITNSGAVGVYDVVPSGPGDSWINSIKFKCVIFSYDGKLWADLFMEGGEIGPGTDLSEAFIDLVKSGVHYLIRLSIDENRTSISSAADTLIAKLPKEGITLERGVVIVNVKALKPAGAMKELFGFFSEPAMQFKKSAESGNHSDEDAKHANARR